MNIVEAYTTIRSVLPKLMVSADYETGGIYVTKGLNSLRHSIIELSKIDFLVEDIVEINDSALFKTHFDVEKLESVEYSHLKGAVTRLRTGLEYLIKYSDQNGSISNENGLFIKLPPITNFEDLSKASNELKKGSRSLS